LNQAGVLVAERVAGDGGCGRPAALTGDVLLAGAYCEFHTSTHSHACPLRLPPYNGPFAPKETAPDGTGGAKVLRKGGSSPDAGTFSPHIAGRGGGRPARGSQPGPRSRPPATAPGPWRRRVYDRRRAGPARRPAQGGSGRGRPARPAQRRPASVRGLR